MMVFRPYLEILYGLLELGCRFSPLQSHSSFDQRGPAVLVRTVVCFVLVVPALLGGAAAGLVLGSPLVTGALGGTLVALGEAALLLAFAARRLAGRVDRLALSQG